MSNFISSLRKQSSTDPLNWKAVEGKPFLIMVVSACVLMDSVAGPLELFLLASYLLAPSEEGVIASEEG